MDTRAGIDVVEEESRRCAAALRSADLAAAVPPCPGWNAADLAWHLAEVQYFWAAIVSGLLADPAEVPDPVRPPDSDVVAFLEEQSRALVAALSSHPPEARCWFWREDRHHVGAVARRQAHEALIHRVDAELTAGARVTAADAGLAADGVDDVLAVMVYLPSWGSFEGGGGTVAVETTDVPGRWVLEVGQFTGTSPNSGRTYDQASVRLLPEADRTDAAVRGPAWELDLWLWSRGGEDAVTTSGAAAVTARFHEALTANTQ